MKGEIAMNEYMINAVVAVAVVGIIGVLVVASVCMKYMVTLTRSKKDDDIEE